MLGFVLAQLRYRKGRAAALVGALLVAVTSFSVLTGAARTQRLSVVGTVTANARGGYDILVRPAGARSALEDGRGLVASTALANLNGGITTAQWQQIGKLPEVDVAAPVAVVGYVLTRMDAPVDLPAAAAGGGRQLYRAAMTQVSERGLTRIPAGESYTYVTDRPLRGVTDSAHSSKDPYEVDGAGAAHPVCVDPTAKTAATGPQVVLNCGTTNPQDTYNQPGPANPHATGSAQPAATTTTAWPVPLLIEAVDPASEARLAGLDKAVTWGSYLDAGRRPTSGTRTYADLTGDPNAAGRVGVTEIPVLMADRAAADEQLQVAVSRLPASAADQVAAGTDKTTLGATLPHTPGTPVTTTTVDVQQAYRTLLDGLRSGDVRETYRAGNGGTVWVSAFTTAQPVRYGSAGDGLTAQPRQPDPNLRLDYEQIDGTYPRDLDDTPVRKAVVHPAGGPWNGIAHDVHLKMVGEFDSSELSVSASGLGAVPMETYFPAQATGADPASVQALGGRSLLPNGNVAGLLSVPPSIVTSLAGLQTLDDARYFTNTGAGRGVNAAAPISVIRVRLTGALGLDALSRERVRLTAQRIHDLTGLDVDITSGSSPTPVAVGDPAGTHGRPALTLHEMWSKKGVAATVVAAVDRKSLIMFVLVLVVCALFVASATGAAVRARRTELAVLACLGWPPRKLFALVVAEVAGLGAVAGVLGAGLAIPLGRLSGLHVGAGRAVLAVPAALLLAVLAASRPALQASRSHPGAAVLPAVSAPRRPVRRAGITRLALANLRRVPGRALLGTLALAIGVAALVALAAISTAFDGTVTGTLLGDAVSVQVRGSDYAAAVIAALLGAATVADVLYLNIRDRAAEYALLSATGWPDRAVTRLVLTEAAVMAVAGAVAGAAVGLSAYAVFAGHISRAAVLPTLATVAGAITTTLLSAALPTRALRHLPLTRHLAE
ncbi:hypothetical protein NMG29_18415 [Streptomyces cocklensis]|uniref:ABC transporter permease n=1 Tax=Actinacidiphila cocklensis TaxID=887465 RepID=A0A9W4DI17_9ACTN|nr:FtsX-like permease family protein [Actinacidiphila cocklensis]MDD1060148.1 hypothetical protein [Actinacidiphila cocklensis]CAG6391726.1 ABC transporter permease [Actinacidiphila cocklensis]